MDSNQPSKPPIGQSNSPRRRRRAWTIVRRTILYLLAFIFLVFILLQLPFFQNWLARQVTNSLSNTLQTEVKVDRVYLAWLDQLDIEGLYIEDKYGDTLLFSEHINANLNLLNFLGGGGLEVESLGLEKTRFQIRRALGDPESNLEYALDRLFPPKNSPSKPFRLNLKRLDFEDISFVQSDSVRGQIFDTHLQDGVIRIRRLDLPANLIEISSGELFHPRVIQTSFAPSPLDSVLRYELELADTATAVAPAANPLQLIADNLEIINGEFQLFNYRKEVIEEGDISAIDFARLRVEDIDLELTELDFRQDSLAGRLKHLSLTEQSGFVLDRLSSQDLLITPTSLQLYDLELITANSQLGDSLAFDFRRGWESWSDFDNQVRMDLRLDESRISIRDLLYFARSLRFNQYFRDNRNRQLTISGRLRDRVNRLRGEDIELQLDRQNYLRGSFRSRNFSNTDPTALNLEMEELVTSMNSLRRIFGTFNPPPNFNKLGRLRFTGKFDGFLNNFLANGDLRTNIGSVLFTDMGMTLPGSVDEATYHGKINLEDFDLGAWTDNEEIGLVNFFAEVANGKSLQAESAEADLSAVIRDLSFRDYTYRNAEIAGRLNRNFFNGDFTIEDQNIDLSFTGELDFRDTIAHFDFAADVSKVDLQALNLSPANLQLSGQVDLNLIDTRINELEGRVLVKDLELTKDDSLRYHIDSILAYSTFDNQGRKVAVLDSDIANGKVVGQFDINQMVPSLKQFLVTHFPGYARRLGITAPRLALTDNQFSFDLELKDSKGLQYLLHPQLGIIKDLAINGGYNSLLDQLELEVDMPNFEFASLRLVDLILKAEAERDEGELDIAVDSTYINDKPQLGLVTFLSLVEGDSITFGLTYAPDRQALLDELNLNGLLFLPDSQNYRIQFDASNLVLFQEPWNISDENSITFGKRFFNTRNFALSSGERRIRLRPQGREGLSLGLENFQLSLIDSLWSYEQLDFSGPFSAEINVLDIFEQEGITANIRADSFLINGDDFGWMRLDLALPKLRDQLSAYLSINQDTSQLIVETTYNLADLVDRPQRLEDQKDYMDLDVNIVGYPLSMADYWVGGSISGVKGWFDAKLEVKGLKDEPEIDGYILARDGRFTIDYLQTTYSFQRSLVDIDNELFDLGGTIIYDRDGNTSELSGGVTHNRLKDLGLSARSTTDRFLSLDLKEGDNELFYGTAYGAGQIDFTGNFRQPDIYVRATVGQGSSLFIPVNSSSSAGPIDNVRFVNRQVYVEEEPETIEAPRGVALEMDLIVTDEAQVEIIFDKEVGDLIRGQGRGDLRIELPRGENMSMFGRYIIEQGNYLFTFYRVVNKEFSVRPGGSIVWSGDPFDAQINIEADYENLRTPINNFIQEYLLATAGNEALAQEAANPTEVDLKLQLRGDLQRPDISFDLDFPDLTGQLQTYADNKRRLLLLDQNELNRQAFGLIVVGQFLPADLSFSGTDVAVNTLSEWLSNYFSLLLNDFFTNTFGEDAFLGDIQFGLAYERFRSADFSQGNVVGNALEVTFRKDLSNRWTLSGDVNFLTNNQLTSGNSGTFVGNDVVLEYVLNDARTLKWRIYQRRQPDIAGGRRLQFGTGFSWRREFNTLGEFFRSFKKDAESN
ncbi:MAG: translocation/assembly module TamB domain-containing protein [Bacteroidota bacterium]